MIGVASSAVEREKEKVKGWTPIATSTVSECAVITKRQLVGGPEEDLTYSLLQLTSQQRSLGRAVCQPISLMFSIMVYMMLMFSE